MGSDGETSYLTYCKANLTKKTVPQKLVLEGSSDSKFILLGEDDPDDQEMLAEVFSSIDKAFTLFFVNNGTEVVSALHKLHDQQLPCLIVLDYNMPGLTGADILREIGSDHRFQKIPKIVWSTSSSEQFKKTCLALGAQDYVIKPSNGRDLKQIALYMLELCGFPEYSRAKNSN